MDGDIFGKVTKLGRAAAEAVESALNGVDLDWFLPSRCLDVLIYTAGGLPSLGVINQELAALRAAPLLARTVTEDVIARIKDATHARGCTELDLVLGSVAQRSIVRGELQTIGVLQRFFGEVLDRAIVCGRGGVLEKSGPSRLDEARALLAPVAGAAAAVLDARPDAKRLGLARRHANIEPTTNLLGSI